MNSCDIKPRNMVSLNIDYGQMGVGGDDSWGKKTLQRYMLNESEYTFGFSLVPVARSPDPAREAEDPSGSE